MIGDKTFMMVKDPSRLGENFGLEIMHLSFWLGFLSWAENYPLSKPMVYHNQERITAHGDREIHD